MLTIRKGDKLLSTHDKLYIVKRIVRHDDRIDEVVLEDPHYGHTFRVTMDQVRRLMRPVEKS